MLQYFYKIYVIYTKNFATMHTVYFCTHFLLDILDRLKKLRLRKIFQAYIIHKKSSLKAAFNIY